MFPFDNTPQTTMHASPKGCHDFTYTHACLVCALIGMGASGLIFLTNNCRNFHSWGWRNPFRFKLQEALVHMTTCTHWLQLCHEGKSTLQIMLLLCSKLASFRWWARALAFHAMQVIWLSNAKKGREETPGRALPTPLDILSFQKFLLGFLHLWIVWGGDCRIPYKICLQA